MDLILREHPTRVFASGGQSVNHLDERYDGRTPDILDNAYVIVEYPSGARALLDLCMFAEGTLDNEQIVVVGDQARLESLLPALQLRYGRREDWGRREVWGQAAGTGRGVSVRRVWDTNIRYGGQHFGASYIEHVRFAAAVRDGLPAEIGARGGLARGRQRPGRASQHRREASGRTLGGVAGRLVRPPDRRSATGRCAAANGQPDKHRQKKPTTCD